MVENHSRLGWPAPPTAPTDAPALEQPPGHSDQTKKRKRPTVVTFSSQVAGGSSSSRVLPNSSATLSPISRIKRRAQNGLGQSSAPVSKQQDAASAGPPSPGIVVLDLVSDDDDDDDVPEICENPAVSGSGRHSEVPVAAQQPQSHPSTVPSPVVVILESQEDDVVLLSSFSPAPLSVSDIQSVAPLSALGTTSKVPDASQVLPSEQQVGLFYFAYFIPRVLNILLIFFLHYALDFPPD